MKMSRIFAGVAALAIAASVAALPAAAADTAYLYTATKSWTTTAPADSVEGEIKFQTNEDGTPKTALGATDLNAWNCGPDKYNGQWVQYVLTSDDLSSVSVKFTLHASDSATCEYHTYKEDETPEAYQLFMTLGKTETVEYDYVNGDGAANFDFVPVTGDWTFEYTGDDIKAAIEDNKAKLSENGDGTYTVGFNIQVGHFTGIEVTGEITADNLYKGADNSGDSSSTAPTSSTTSSSSSSSSSSATSSSSKSGSTTSTKSGSTSTAAAAASSKASDNTNAGTGATAGIALAGLALAGAAAVVAKRK